MRKRVLLFVLPFLLLGCSRAETNQTEKEIIEANIRVKNEIVQYRDENGTWKDLTTVEILQNLTAEEPVTDSREDVIISTGTNGTDGKAGTDGKEGQRGPQGIQGRTGATGATGPRGNDGRNGKDSTQVTISEDGELILDGKRTGYILLRKLDDSAEIEFGCVVNASWNGNSCECNQGYIGDGYSYCRPAAAEPTEAPMCADNAYYNEKKGACVCNDGYSSRDPANVACRVDATPTPSTTPTPMFTPTPVPTQTCWDGSVIPVMDACPADTRVTCWDGSVALSESACPAQPQPENTPDNNSGGEGEGGNG